MPNGSPARVSRGGMPSSGAPKCPAQKSLDSPPEQRRPMHAHASSHTNQTTIQPKVTAHPCTSKHASTVIKYYTNAVHVYAQLTVNGFFLTKRCNCEQCSVLLPAYVIDSVRMPVSTTLQLSPAIHTCTICMDVTCMSATTYMKFDLMNNITITNLMKLEGWRVTLCYDWYVKHNRQVLARFESACWKKNSPLTHMSLIMRMHCHAWQRW